MSFYNGGKGGFMSSVPPVTKNIILINVLVWIMTVVNESFMIEHFAMFYPSSPFFKPWQIVTHMFMHGGFWHLFFNMYTLFIFGGVLERVWGTRKFLIFYFVTGLGAVALHTGVQWIEAHQYMSQIADGNVAAATSLHALKMTPTVGASGAIFGLLMGYAMLFPDLPSCVIEGKMVCVDIHCHRACYGSIQHRRRNCSFRPSGRNAVRMAYDPLLEKKAQTVSIRIAAGWR